ncbi:MAG: hypothetical protein IPJ36_04930 [Simplicispira sp.]|nr:hypothetical protein [Simplicispira sp.]
MFTDDPGFRSTAARQSAAINGIDGDGGELFYRCHLDRGNCYAARPPIPATGCSRASCPPYGAVRFHSRDQPHHGERGDVFLAGLSSRLHPMAVLTGLIGALSAFYHDSIDITNP